MTSDPLDRPALLIAAVRDKFGPRAAITDPADVAPWLTDWRGRFHGRSAGIFAPASTAEVAAIVGLAAQHRVPLVPQGGNTSMVGGATPPEDGSALILSLRRMNALRSIDAAANLAVAEAGMILADLHDRAGEVGRRFPLTLGARGSCTVGGLIATGIGVDGWIDMSNGLRLKKAADFDPGTTKDERYATERFAFCVNSRGEVTSYGI